MLELFGNALMGITACPYAVKNFNVL